MTDTKPGEHPETDWLTRNWPWWIALFTLVVYEFWALSTGQRTLSRMVWTSVIAYPWMVPIVFSFLSWLIPHFFLRKAEWVWTGVFLAITWIVYFSV